VRIVSPSPSISRRRVGLLLLVLPFLGAGAVGAAPHACAVRLARSMHATKTLPSILGGLPFAPVDVAPLLAASVDNMASSGGPGPAHALADWIILRFADDAALAQALPLLRAQTSVAEVEPIRLLALDGDEDAAAIGVRQEAEIPWNIERVGAVAALGLIEPDPSLIVAVIDTGADLSHPDLVAQLWSNDDPPGNASPNDDTRDQNADGVIEAWEQLDDDDNGYVDDLHGFDFTDAPGQSASGDAVGRDNDPSDQNGHGTHVAGIIAANGRVRGVAPFVRLMPVRAAFNQFLGSGALETDDAAAAIVYAVDNGARILNLSWGDREESNLVRAALEYAAAHDVVIVAAAGNGASAAAHFPSSDPRVIGVAASNRNGTRTAFSNFGATAGVVLAAPGEESAFPGRGIRSLLPLAFDDDGVRDGLGERRGTSMSAPHVAGVAALVLCRADRPDAGRTRALLVAGARRANAADWTPDLGHGEVDAVGAVQTDDDLTVAILGPETPFAGERLTLIGTVLSGDLPRRSLSVLHLPSGSTRVLLHAELGQVVADTLVSVPFAGEPEGDWELALHVETADGRERQWHGGFRLDRSPPVIDTLVVESGWKSGEPRWLVSMHADEPVRASVRQEHEAVPFLADAGWATRLQMEGPATPQAESAWIVRLEDANGSVTEASLPAPARLETWDAPETLQLLDRDFNFQPTDTWGQSPLGAVVWGRKFLVANLARMQAVAVQNDRFVRVFDCQFDGFPQGFADTNGDGAADLLFQGSSTGLGATWLVTRGAAAFPDSILATVREQRAIGFFALDEDPAFEAILSRDNRLFLYDDATAGAPRLMQVLDNPDPSGFATWGADAAAGDFDADGQLEFACGDAEGFISVFERAPSGLFELQHREDSGGTYAYDLSSMPEGGFVVGSQRSKSVTGDGFATVVVAFDVHAPDRATYPFLAPVNVLEFGSAVAESPSTGATWLALVQGSDLYLARGAREPRAPRLHAQVAEGRAPAFADLDADGRLELVLRNESEATLWRLVEDESGPYALRSESLGPDRLRLSWTPGASGISRVERLGLDGLWETRGETTAATWIDSTLVAFAPYQYTVLGVTNGQTLGATNGVAASAQPLPRLLDVRATGADALRLRTSNRLHPATLVPQRFVVSTGGVRHAVQQLTVAEDGRVVDLLLATALDCGSFRVETDSLRDDQWGLLAGEASRIDGRRDCDLEAFVVQRVELTPSGIEIVWSREPDSLAQAPDSYTLKWDAMPLAIARVEWVAPERTRLVVTDTPFVGRGIPYLLRVEAPVRARADGEPLTGETIEHRVYIEGQGAPHVFPVPNPVRGEEVVFVEAAADTRVQIFDLEGQLVHELSDALGGGLRWDLRNSGGGTVASGIYLFVARDARGTSRGRLAILR